MNGISRLGLGCVTFGREIDAAASFALMDAAIARGITHFDTAAAYAAGASETIVGQWLAARQPTEGSLLIATKILPPYTPEQIVSSVEQSRRRLGRATIPLLYLHRWDESAVQPETLAVLDRLVCTGQVGALGASNFSADRLEQILALQNAGGLTAFTAIQNNHNFAVRDVTARLRAIAGAHGIAIVTYSPLGAGFLSGKHAAGVEPGSRFALIPGHQQVYFHPESQARLAALQQLAKELGTTSARLALIWALHQPETASVLVGGRTLAHLDQAFEAAHAPAEVVAAVTACCSEARPR